jgi:hypothetical protein
MAHSPAHEFPFHFVGMIEDDKRYVIIGLTNEQAVELYMKLGTELNGTTQTENPIAT